MSCNSQISVQRLIDWIFSAFCWRAHTTFVKAESKRSKGCINHISHKAIKSYLKYNDNYFKFQIILSIKYKQIQNFWFWQRYVCIWINRNRMGFCKLWKWDWTRWKLRCGGYSSVKLCFYVAGIEWKFRQ